MVDLVGFEPTPFWVQIRRSSQLELQAHILQNTSRANYLLSAATLVSWSAEPHHIRLPSVIVSGSHLNKKHQATYLAIYRIFQLFLRADSSPSVAPKQPKNRISVTTINLFILCATRRALTGVYSPYPMWVSISHIESLSVTFEQGKVNIYL